MHVSVMKSVQRLDYSSPFNRDIALPAIYQQLEVDANEFAILPLCSEPSMHSESEKTSGFCAWIM
jgi:hypothetical protein